MTRKEKKIRLFFILIAQVSKQERILEERLTCSQSSAETTYKLMVLKKSLSKSGNHD